MSGTRTGALLAWCAATLLGLAALIGGIDLGLESHLADLRAELRRHPASGAVVLVEIDARSLARLHRWPWPRSLYVRALDRLSAAGVRSIGFDVDFSAPSDPADDQAFAAALARAGGGVYLSTFRQQSGFGADSLIDSLPIAPLRAHSFLAAVNVFPDADGMVTRYPLSVITRDTPRPSIAAMLAETPVRAGDSFQIDYAIDPATLPRISFVDLVEGRVPPARLAGKRVLIGATAIELGDRYAAPLSGVIPGAVIQALAAETLLAHGAPLRIDGLAPLAAVLLVLGVALRAGRTARVAIGSALGLLLLLGPIVADARGITIVVAPALFAIAALLLGEFGLSIADELARRRFVDRDSGLPNRAALEAAGAQAPQAMITVAWFGTFHEIATALGRAHGARLIERLAARAAAATGATIYRVDEGAIAWLSPAEAERDDADAHFAALFGELRDSAALDGVAVDLRPSFGTVVLGQGETGAAVAGALIAAQRARAEGLRWKRSVSDEGAEQRQRLALLGELSEALRSGAIWVAYQPKFSLAEGRIVGAEALVRWRHPTRGAIPPDAFIPLVEAEGRAFELTEVVLERALADLATWRADGADVGVAVNLSATLLEEPALVASVAAALERHDVPPGAVTIELTESAIMADSVASAQRLHALRRLGVRLSIDDYGTGQSTLSYLRKVPANELKIDKSFVQDLVGSASDRLLVSSTLELAHALDLKVVAEGIEDAATEAVLRTLGCDVIQGWHTGRPVPAADFHARLRDERAPLAA